MRRGRQLLEHGALLLSQLAASFLPPKFVIYLQGAGCCLARITLSARDPRSAPKRLWRAQTRQQLQRAEATDRKLCARKPPPQSVKF